MCPRDREEVFHHRPAVAGACIAIHLVESNDMLVEHACAAAEEPPLSPLSNVRPVPRAGGAGLFLFNAPACEETGLEEVQGLTKIEAEELLDWLEAGGYQLCDLSHVPGKGFTVQYR